MGRKYIVEEVESSSSNGCFWIVIAVVVVGVIMASSKCTPYQEPGIQGAVTVAPSGR